MIELVAIKHHEHYPDGSTVRVLRCPGERYRVDDAPGLTAAQYAERMIALGVAAPVPHKPKTKGPRPCE